MNERMKMQLWIDHPRDIPGGLIVYLGYFDCQIDSEQSQIIADLIWSFKEDEFVAFVATYLFNSAKWKTSENLGWKSSLKKTFTRKYIFPNSVEYEWVIGTCPSAECLQETIYTGWNLSGNESFIVALVKDLNEVLPSLDRTFQDGLETIEDNELQWVDYCPLVFSRDHDGLTLRIYTIRLNEPQLRQHLELFLHSREIELVLAGQPL